ncbi:putative ABC transporter ATP-binding protein/MT1014 [Pelagimonas phthalicica]|uniref:Putative ABC transporter ATP-binding protein/MT1014 n=1 Tax=Pelagimonas phthalicica TaxID=1037362 RepID=A0A238JD98_9RHOB|nr:ABC transporter ATP-binding protein [Pelagimonas phthalicica]TDS91336.1 putative ABC transport system ATP-binding protein [Pelagimonas phthalicica]SMX28385.1 putative ABC transporter ATP-binding protein/MT1014 [Pelagimonas phthalicica]
MSEPKPDTCPAIRLRGIAFDWKGKHGFALDIPQLEITIGEKVFLSGESGSGKSTLLSLICGIVTPDAGQLEVNGTDLTTLSARQKDRLRADQIGLIFQQFNLLPYASPLENILLPLSFSAKRSQRVSAPQQEALRLCQALGLSEAQVSKAATSDLSTGQQQRVAVARALIGGPSVVIADEPTSALDAASQSAFVDLLIEQVEAANATLLMVSHDTRLAQHFDRSISMAELVQRGDIT